MPASQARIEFVALPNRWAVTDDATVKTAHPLAREHEIVTLLDEEVDAQAVADALGPLMAGFTRRFRMTAHGVQWQIHRGDTITLKDDAWSPAGKNVLVLRVRERIGGNDEHTELEVIG